MGLRTKDAFEDRVERLRALDSALSKLARTKYSVLDEISFRIAISTATWYYGVVAGLPKETMNKLPKRLQKVLNEYYQLSDFIDDFYRSIKNDGELSIRAYLGVRKRMLSVIRNIRRGLMGASLREMQEVVSVLKSNLSLEGNYPKGNFDKFWSSYSKAKAYFDNEFLPSFPSSYDPRVEPVYSAGLEKTMNLEEFSLDSALTENIVVAISVVEEWHSFMKDFLSKREYSSLTPKRVI